MYVELHTYFTVFFLIFAGEKYWRHNVCVCVCTWFSPREGQNITKDKNVAARIYCRYPDIYMKCAIYSEVVVITMMWLKLLRWCSSLE